MSRRVPARYFVVPMLAIASSTAWGVDRQIGVDASLKVGYSQLTGGAPSPWGVAQSVAVGFWQRSSGAAQGVGSNNIATMEYQLPEVQPTRIRSAIFQFSGRAIQCPGDEQVVVDVFAYPGDGRSDVTDSTAGTRVATLSADCKDNPAFNKPIDVTHLVRQLSVPSGVRHVGFNVRKGNNRRGPGFFAVYPGQAQHRRCRSGRRRCTGSGRTRRYYLGRTSRVRFPGRRQSCDRRVSRRCGHAAGRWRLETGT